MKMIFIGPLGGGKIPNNGASVKNQFLIEKLKKISSSLFKIDTEAWRRRPWILLKILWIIVWNRNAIFVISTSDNSANKLIKILHYLCNNAKIYYWVIGGALGRTLSEGIYSLTPYKSITKIFVEGKSMQLALENLGLKNVKTVPNFKIIPIVKHRIEHRKKIKFVFLSRIIPAKGIIDIFDAVSILNHKGLENQYEIDFYGPIENSFNSEFNYRINMFSNISYRGFLNLKDVRNYEILADYDIMLFPTYWKSEGCPGVVIDAYIAGIPIIASRWNLNEDYIDDGITGLLVEPQNPHSLASEMRKVITGQTNLSDLKKNAASKAANYNIDVVLSEKVLNTMISE